jgi:hypothetical protein
MMETQKEQTTQEPQPHGVSVKQLVMPMQPIVNGRFIPNRIVETLLNRASFGLNEIARMDFTDQERMQFAQLIGYSISGFSELSYVDDETYEAACSITSGMNEVEARNDALREQLDEARKGLKIAVGALFKIHPDDLEA